ncbi:MAG: PASTA domain-containing protein [Candidatus Competibacteraceae bacterium]|nr:PASTA domain-containing protein [Candidatus Competibacteraceae bacterium]
MIRGWSCEAGRVEVSVDGGPLQATASGTNRPDTATVCGRTDTGFGLIYNWNRIGEGLHNLRALANGVEFANVNFTVATLGGEFRTGLQGSYTVPDFPAAGSSAKIAWSEPHQNFVFTSPITVPPVSNPPSSARALLESPSQGSSESGIGLIRGWVCATSRVEVSIDGGPLQVTAHGTDRPDTTGACGRADTGFGLTHNWNSTGQGVHNIRAFADGVEFANVNFAVTTLGGDFLTGLLNTVRLLGFPGTGAAAAHAGGATEPATTVEWSEADQNFVIANSTAAPPKIAVVSAVTDILNKFAVLGVGSNLSNTLGVHTSKNPQGQPTDVGGVTWADTNAQTWADLTLGADGLPRVYQDSSGVEARLDQYTANSVVVQFFDSNGQTRSEPVTTPINSSLLQNLQQLVNQLKQATAGASTASAQLSSSLTEATANAAETDASLIDSVRFSLNALLVRLFGSGGIAAGELLCTIRTAAATVGTGDVVAATGCQSPLVTDFLALANNPSTQATPADAALDFKFQQSLQLVQDVIQAPCTRSGDSAGCLFPAAAVLRVTAAPARSIPPDSGSTTIPVPDVVGLNSSAAAAEIGNAGLTAGHITEQSSATVPIGNVISQNPAAGTLVAPGTRVDLVRSLGPAPSIVPNVVGQAQSAATAALTNAGLTVGSVTQQVSATVPAGTVISQNPAAGAAVAPGSAVSLVVSSGPAPVTVPNVVGQTQSAAATALSNAGLTVGSVTQQVSATVPIGNVISQNPAAGAAVALGSAVNLVVSSGPAPVTVPNVVGQTQSAAATALSNAGLTVGNVTPQTSSTVPAGTVISQNPAAGAAVARGSAVNLVVSSGPPPATVPNVVGLSQQNASTVLAGAGLTVGSITYQGTTSSRLDGQVARQNPAAGTTVAAGTSVDLIVYQLVIG